MKNSFNEWKRTGVIKNREIWLLKKDGSSFPVMLNANNLYDESGNLIGSNTVMRDISEIFSAKKEIEDLRSKRLTVIGEMSARIAHDMRNPLSILKNSMDLIKMRISNPDEGLLNNLGMAQRAISRMSHQIEEVLDYVTPEPLHLVDETLSKILSASLQKSHLPEDVTINLPSNEVKIVCDPKKMEIVFINLITNAIQAMDNKGRIDVRANYDEDYVVIDMEDTGTGIPEHLLGKIFDPLFTTRQIGTGLGLPSIKSIIEKHGGTVQAKNSADKGGALFTIKLPRSIC
jgi:signal transduction histidine kinase